MPYLCISSVCYKFSHNTSGGHVDLGGKILHKTNLYGNVGLLYIGPITSICLIIHVGLCPMCYDKQHRSPHRVSWLPAMPLVIMHITGRVISAEGIETTQGKEDMGENSTHKSFGNKTCFSFPDATIQIHAPSVLCIINILILVQVRLRTEVLCTPSSTQPEFKLMTSRSCQYISCHWDACSNHSAISNWKSVTILDVMIQIHAPGVLFITYLCLVTLVRLQSKNDAKGRWHTITALSSWDNELNQV